MAVIQKIRNQSGLLIGAIGVSMILFLLGGDFLTSGGGLSSGQTTDIAEINGDKVSYVQFENMVEQQINKTYGAQPIDQQTREQVRQRIWSQLLSEKILFSEYDKLGLNVSADEIFYQVKSNNPVLTQFFTNPQTGRIYDQLADPATGALNPQAVLAAIKQMINNPEGESSWLQIEAALKEDRFTKKYTNLIKKGINVTTKEAEAEFVDKNKRISFDYVFKSYDEVADESVQVSESDLSDYFNAHKNESFYQQKEPTRGLEYVIFKVEPSEEDLREIQEDINGLIEPFQQTKEDTAFVIENADNPLRFNYYTEGSFPNDVDSILFNQDSNKVVGPYVEDNKYKLAKVIDTKFAPDSVEARHILLKINNGDTAKTQSLADSLMKVIKSQKNFAELAEEFSEDFGSAQEGGDLGWFTEGTMVKPFNDACFEGKTGDMVTVTSQFGIHLIEITDQTEAKKKCLVAIVDREMNPSKVTFDKVYNQASAFSINNNATNSFRSAGNEIGLRVADAIREGDKSIAGVPNSREVVRWAFQANIGDVSEAFELDNQFIVAHLREVREKGTLSLDNISVKERVRKEVVKQKKAEVIKAEMNGGDLASIASKLGKEIQSAKNVSFSAYSIPGVGGEMKLLGTLFSLEKGALSNPIADNKGVYVAVVKEINEPAGTANLAIAKAQKNRTISGRVDYEVSSALFDASEIVDNRGKFY